MMLPVRGPSEMIGGIAHEWPPLDFVRKPWKHSAAFFLVLPGDETKRNFSAARSAPVPSAALER